MEKYETDDLLDQLAELQEKIKELESENLRLNKLLSDSEAVIYQLEDDLNHQSYYCSGWESSNICE